MWDELIILSLLVGVREICINFEVSYYFINKYYFLKVKILKGIKKNIKKGE